MALALNMVAGALLAGCDTDFESPTRVVGTRLIGAQTSVIGDEARSTPRPGETARVHHSLVAPYPGVDEDDLYSLFIVCTYPSRFTGIPICQELLDLLEEGSAGPLEALVDTSQAGASGASVACEGEQNITFAGVTVICMRGRPDVDVVVPDDFDGESRLLRGVICEGGTPTLDPSNPALFGCEGARTTMPAYGPIRVARGDDELNLSPAPEAISLQLDGRDWEPPGENLDELFGDGGCAEGADAAGLLRIDPFEHDIRVSLRGAASEETEDGCETMEFFPYATAGELDRRFLLFEDGLCEDPDGRERQHINWVGSDVDRRDTDGTVVDFFFTVNDGRGGFTVVRRAACVHTLEPFGGI